MRLSKNELSRCTVKQPKRYTVEYSTRLDYAAHGPHRTATRQWQCAIADHARRVRAFDATLSALALSLLSVLIYAALQPCS